MCMEGKRTYENGATNGIIGEKCAVLPYFDYRLKTVFYYIFKF